MWLARMQAWGGGFICPSPREVRMRCLDSLILHLALINNYAWYATARQLLLMIIRASVLCVCMDRNDAVVFFAAGTLCGWKPSQLHYWRISASGCVISYFPQTVFYPEL